MKKINKLSSITISTIFYLAIAIVSVALFIIFAKSYIPKFATEMYCYTVNKIPLLSISICKKPLSDYNVLIKPLKTNISNTTSSGKDYIKITDNLNHKIKIPIYGENNLINSFIIINNTNSKATEIIVSQTKNPRLKKIFKINQQNKTYQYFIITNLIKSEALNNCNKYPCNVSLNITIKGSNEINVMVYFNTSYYFCPILDSIIASILKCGFMSKWGYINKNINCVNLNYDFKCQQIKINQELFYDELKKYNLLKKFKILNCENRRDHKICIVLNQNINTITGLTIRYNSTNKSIIISS